MTLATFLDEPGRVDEPHQAQDYSRVLTTVAAESRPVIVCRNGEDLAAIVPLEQWEFMRELLAQQDVNRLAERIDWPQARQSLRPAAEWFSGDEPKPF